MNVVAMILVLLNGQTVWFQGTQPVNDRGVVLVPVRGVFQAMGARVDYNAVTREVTAQKGGTKIEMAVGRMHAWVNGKQVELPQPVRLQNGRVLIPARFVAEALGARVVWDQERSRVLISMDKSAAGATPSTAINAAPIRVTFTSDKQIYRAGENVTFTLIARNTSDKEQVLNFNSGQSFDISITPTNQDEALWRWDWSFGRFFTEALREKTLKPHQAISFNATWDQTDNSGKPMPRGEYSVNTKLTASSEIKSNGIVLKLVK